MVSPHRCRTRYPESALVTHHGQAHHGTVTRRLLANHLPTATCPATILRDDYNHGVLRPGVHSQRTMLSANTKNIPAIVQGKHNLGESHAQTAGNTLASAVERQVGNLGVGDQHTGALDEIATVSFDQTQRRTLDHVNRRLVRHHMVEENLREQNITLSRRSSHGANCA